MADLILYVPFNVDPAFNVVRGMSNEYDVKARIPISSSDTGWTISSPVFSTGMQTIGVSSDGVITLVLKHWADSFDSIVVSTSQNDYEIKVIMKDFFPSNFTFQPFSFYSSFRSHDGTARKLWKANYISPLTTPAFDSAEVIASSDDTGYLDESALLFDCLAIGAEGVLELTTIVEQKDGTGVKDPVLLASAKPAYAGNVQGGTLRLLLQNGRPYFTSIWTPSQFNSNWLEVQRTGCDYVLAHSAATDFSGFHAMYSMQRRIGVDFQDFNVGDDNTYPGFHAGPGLKFKYHTNSNPDDLLVNFLLEWGIALGSSTKFNSTNSTRESGYYRVRSSDQRHSNRFVANSGAHGGSGITIDISNWDFSEFAIYDIGNSENDGSSFRANDLQIIDNLVAVFGGARFDYQ